MPVGSHDLTLKVDTTQLDAALSALPIRLQKQVLVPALERAGEVIADAIRTKIPDKWPARSPGSDALPPGILKYDIQTNVTVSPKTGARVRVGPTTIAGHVARWQNDGWILTGHGSRGRRKRVQRKNGPNPIPGLYFMQSGADESADSALDVLTAALSDGLQAIARGYENAGKDENYSGENY